MPRRSKDTPIDLPRILVKAAEVQAELDGLRERLKATLVTGSAGGGAVEVTVAGDLSVRSVTIQQSVLDDGDPDVTSDMVRVATNQALSAARQAAASLLGGVTGGGTLEGGLG